MLLQQSLNHLLWVLARLYILLVADIMQEWRICRVAGDALAALADDRR